MDDNKVQPKSKSRIPVKKKNRLKCTRENGNISLACNTFEDAVRMYRTEGSPANVSHVGSRSDLSALDDSVPSDGEDDCFFPDDDDEPSEVAVSESEMDGRKNDGKSGSNGPEKFVNRDSFDYRAGSDADYESLPLEKVGFESTGEEETQFRLSRCSSMHSFGSFEEINREIADDKYSAVASGIVTPSELLDTPNQSIPQSPKRCRSPEFFSDKEMDDDVQENIKLSRASSVKSLILEETIEPDFNLKTNSSASSVVSLDIREDDENVEQVVPDEPDLTEEEKMILTDCINAGIEDCSRRTRRKNNLSRNCEPEPFKMEADWKIAVDESGCDRENNYFNYESLVDDVHNYQTEGTPAAVSHSGSLSDLSIASSVPGKPVRLPIAEEDDDYMLEECIRSGMPKGKASAKKSERMPNLNKEMDEISRSIVNFVARNEDVPSNFSRDLPGKTDDFCGAGQFVSAEETPLMFSRCSSMDSLVYSEQNYPSIPDDKSSVASESSRAPSGLISPSEIPDSPTQTVPPSPKKSARNFKDYCSQIDCADGESKSSRNDLKSKRIEGERERLNSGPSVTEHEQIMLTFSINIGIQGSRQRPKENHNKRPLKRDSSGASWPKLVNEHNGNEESRSVPAPRNILLRYSDETAVASATSNDTVRIFEEEGTPASISHSGSLSDLSFLSEPKSVSHAMNSDAGFSSAGEDDLLAECIRSGMPKRKSMKIHSSSNACNPVQIKVGNSKKDTLAKMREFVFGFVQRKESPKAVVRNDGKSCECPLRVDVNEEESAHYVSPGLNTSQPSPNLSLIECEHERNVNRNLEDGVDEAGELDNYESYEPTDLEESLLDEIIHSGMPPNSNSKKYKKVESKRNEHKSFKKSDNNFGLTKKNKKKD